MIKRRYVEFFEKSLEMHLKYNREFLKYDMFRTCIDTSITSPDMYIKVEEKAEDYIYWLPIEKQKEYDFTSMEKELSISIHKDIKEYFNFYYFLEFLTGTPEIGDIYMFAVREPVGLDEFYQYIKDASINNSLDNGIQLGYSDIGPILVDNVTREVKLQNHSRREYDEPIFYDKLTDSLAEFMKPKFVLP